MSHGIGPRFSRVVFLIGLILFSGTPSRAAAAPRVEDALGPFDTPLAAPPLAPPLDLTGGFCEYRVGHFHAGFDFGTGKRVGKPVLAPAKGHVARIRASGVGYGRSIYLATDDGRLLQFGHLDAYAEPLASYVRAGAGLERPVRAGPVAGGETVSRRGRAGDRLDGPERRRRPSSPFRDPARGHGLSPYRAGLAPSDSAPPALASLTLEPLDDASFVEGSAAPITRRLGAQPETVRVIGRLRSVVVARDGVWRGVDRMVPWSVGLEWQGEKVECRFDSVSWATDMAEGDMVYDAGRVVGDKGLMLWAPAGFRPRVMVTDAPLARDAGTIVVRRGDPPRALSLWACDLGGNRTERVAILIPGPGPDTAKVGGRAAAGRRMRFASLPEGFVRVTDRRVPQGTSRARAVFGASSSQVALTGGSDGYTAVLPLADLVSKQPSWLTIGTQGNGPKGRWLSAESMLAARLGPGDSVVLEPHAFRVRVPKGAAFEPALLLARGDEPTSSAGELRSAGPSLVLEPEALPLRRAVRIGVVAPAGAARTVALYRLTDEGWDWIGGTFDAARGEMVAESRRLGRFALMRDTLAPRVTLRRLQKSAPSRPYSGWQLEATVAEAGSGLDARASYFMVDGKRVPSEWDSEERILRWRPARRPLKGKHRVTVVAADRAGNTRRAPGSFVLD